MNRRQRAELAQETIEICTSGYYNIGGESVDLADSVTEAVKKSILYKPERFDALLKQREQAIIDAKAPFSTEFEVTNETTLSAAQRLNNIKTSNICTFVYSRP